MSSRYFSTPKPRVFGHRGAAGVAPENTVESFRRAVADGAEILELDVHATRDGEIVVIHDESVDRTTNGRGLVREMALKDLRLLDAGCRFEQEGAFPWRRRGVRIPTLRELLDAFPETPLNVEIKQEQPPIEAAVVDLLRREGGLDRIVLAAEKDPIMRRIREAGEGAQTSLAAGEATDFFQRVFADDLGAYEPPGLALQIPPAFQGTPLVTPETVRAAHRHGLEMHVWTINDEAEMGRLLDLGVDGVMSDLPGKLRAVVDRRSG